MMAGVELEHATGHEMSCQQSEKQSFGLHMEKLVADYNFTGLLFCTAQFLLGTWTVIVSKLLWRSRLKWAK